MAIVSISAKWLKLSPGGPNKPWSPRSAVAQDRTGVLWSRRHLCALALRKRTRSRRRNRPFDQGFSLVEIIMTISIMSIILVPALDAVVATIRAGTSANSFSDTNLVLQNAADRVNRAPKSCDYTQYAQAAAQTNGWAAATTSVVQQHYVPGARQPTPAGGTTLPVSWGLDSARSRSATGHHFREQPPWPFPQDPPGGKERCLERCVSPSPFETTA